MSLFESIDNSSQNIQIKIEGRNYSVPEGISVAAAILLCGFSSCRSTSVSGSPRAPYCMMGVCFDCLVEVNGASNQQGCLIQAREGMVVRWQDGKAIVGQLDETP